MATITYPAGRDYDVLSAEFGLRASVILSTSTLSGATQTVEMPGARWICTLTYNSQDSTLRARLEALFASLRGQANRLSMGHPLRREPRGTLRGTPTLSGAHSALATTIAISGTGTLLAGDMLGVGSGASAQLVMVTSDVTGSLAAVPISPPLRYAQSSGATVTWDQPRTLWLVNGDSVRVPLGPVVSGSFSVDLVEVFS